MIQSDAQVVESPGGVDAPAARRSYRDTPVTSLRMYIWSRRVLLDSISCARAAFTGVWLGMLTSEAMTELDQYYYSGGFDGYVRDYVYESQEHNAKGFMPWEQQAIRTYFSSATRVVILAVGAGRELIALRNGGFTGRLDGFECHPSLRQAGNRILNEMGLADCIQPMARSTCPTLDSAYDAAIVGWGAYMLVPTREERIALLVGLREHLSGDAPLLLSFMTRRASERYVLVARVANLIRALRRARRVIVGDTLLPNFVHCFTKREMAMELDEAGFDMVYFSGKDYGHAVAIAR